ncbi:DMT family transporter [Desulfosoma caldarium]|uniref:Threonine/homoserine efflux transporter RhtA n=1 Tax=Desulfosoma caldarium TaxID=610254 RepID=A0A3N1UM65_9BACT|nr:DMT family transporter [Desulfosoma caldarium]ROQ92304.1 threonine/homoserine efflux transporter RhtA [Desulfosoma caldarium]
MGTIYIKLTMTAVLWGGTFIAGRMIAGEVPPFSAAFLRFVWASVFLFGSFLRRGRSMSFPLKHWSAFLVLGLTGIFAYNAFFFSGLKRIPASRASLIIACNPAMIALFSAILFKEHLGARRCGGIALSVLGAVIVISRGHPWSLWHGGIGVGDLLILGCVASWVAYSLMGKRVMNAVSPEIAVAYSCLAGTALLAIPASAERVWSHLWTFSWTSWIGMFYLGFFGSFLGFRWYYEGIQAIGPARAGVFINLVPLSAMAMAVLFLGEQVEASLIVGALAICLGVTLTNRA